MTKYIILSILFLLTHISYAQYNGMDSVNIGTSNIRTLIYPRAVDRVPGKKYAVIIHYNSDSTVGANLSLMFKTGFPRQVALGKVQGTIADSIIHVCPQSPSLTGMKTPAMFNQVVDYVLATLPFDSTYVPGTTNMFKYLCIGGMWQGATDALDNLGWYLTGYGALKYTGRIYHAYFVSITNVFPAQQYFDNMRGTNSKFFHETNVQTCCQAWPAQNVSTKLAGQGYNTVSTFKSLNFIAVSPSTYNGHDNYTADSAYSTKSLDSANNIYLWVLGRTLLPPSTSVKLKVYESSLYDLSARLMHKDRPFNYFDGNPSVDPKNGGNTFSPLLIADEIGKVRMIRGDTTDAVPNSGRDASYYYGSPSYNLAFANYYFPGKRGRCIIVDLCNEPSLRQALITHGKKFKLTDIYGFERNFEANDSLFFYNFDKVIEEPDIRKIPYMISRPDSCLTPFAILVTQGGTTSSGAWDQVSVNDSMRYIMIRNTLQQRSGYTSTAYYKELVFYGSSMGDSAKLPQAYNGPLPKQRTLYEKAGVNTGVQIDTNVMNIVGNVRQYVNVDWYDDDTTASTKYKQFFNAEKFTGYKAWNQYWTPHNLNHWIAPFGASKRTVKEWGGVNTRNNIDSIYVEPGDWMHYISHGRLFYQLAYKWGWNTSLNGSKYRFYNDAVLTGYAQKWHPYLEFGNEDDTYEPPSVSAAKLIMAVNGNKSYFGDTLGVVNADPYTKLMPAGQTFPDTFRIRTVMLLAYIMMKDTTPRLMDVFSYHSYSRIIDTISNVLGPTYEEQVGNKGLLPELNDWYNKSDRIAKYIWKITGDTSIKSWNTEYGWDNFSTAPTSVSQLSAQWTTTGTPNISGYDSVQSKAISMMRIELMMGGSSLDGFTEFNAHNGSLDQTNNVYVNFYTCGWGGGNYSLTTKFPNYYSKKWMYARAGNYYIDQVIRMDTANAWVMKWRKKGQYDSVMYTIWKGSQNGSTVSSVPINIGTIQNNTVNQEVYNFSTLTSDITTLSGNSTINITAAEMPKFLFVKEINAPYQPPVIINVNVSRFKILAP